MSIKNLLYSLHSRFLGIDDQGSLVIQNGTIRSGDGQPIRLPDGIALDVEVTAEGYLTSVNGNVGPNVTLTQDDIDQGVTYARFTQLEKSKLTGIAAGATLNSADATLLSRTNHTGTQAQSTITNLTTDLAGKAASSHTHLAVNITDLSAAVKTVIASTLNVTGDGSGSYNSGTGIYTISTSGGAGSVSSVNGQTGATITLDQDDIGDGTTAKQFTATEKTKLSGIATGATANDTDSNLKARANHTGTQAISTVTGLQTALDGKAATSHTHTASQITDFNTAVDARITAGGGAGITSVNGQTGSSVTLVQDDVGDGSIYKRFSGTEKTKLAGIATGATANSTDTYLLNRTYHTGTQQPDTVAGLNTAMKTRFVHPNEFTVSGYAASAAQGVDTVALSGSAFVVRRLQFDNNDTTIVQAGFQMIPPSHVDLSGLVTVKVRAFKTSTSSGNLAQLLVRCRALGAGDFGSIGAWADAGSAMNFDFSAGQRVMVDQTATIEIENYSVANPYLYFELIRDSTTANAANDNMSQSLSVAGMTIVFTSLADL